MMPTVAIADMKAKSEISLFVAYLFVIKRQIIAAIISATPVADDIKKRLPGIVSK
jgi:hypothetical protein